MFGNFIYFIVALLIYTTYTPSATPRLPLPEAIFAFLGLALLFGAITRSGFKRLSGRFGSARIDRLEQDYNNLLTRQSIMAVAVYAIDVYIIDIGSHLNEIVLFNVFPTMEAVLFLCMFIIYLGLVWTYSYEIHDKLYRTGVSRRSYVVSNISFAVPVLLPWFFLSILADIITALPYEVPREFLKSTQGQVIYFLFFLLVIAIIGPALIQKFWGCRPLKSGYERLRIEHICRKAGLSYRDIMLWPLFGGRMITAGVMGLVHRFRYILVTPALLHHLDPLEIDAVMAHEIGHVKQKHLVFYLFFFVGYLVIAFAALDLIIYSILYTDAVFGWTGSKGSGQTASVSIAFSIAMITIFFVYFRYVFGYFMRNFERQADIYVYRLLDSAAPLISTLKKIADNSGQSPDKPNWHHFSITRRIDYLERCETDRHWIRRHHRKIGISIVAYILVMTGIGWGGYHLHYGGTGKILSTGIFEKAIQQQMEENPDNPELYLLLGDLHQSTGKHSAAVSAYRRAIELEPDNARALNNLAWLHATAEEKRLRDPQKALELAQRAANIAREPHVLDTLAESYFINGMHDKAVETEREALILATENHSYYRNQLKRFRQAASGP